MVTVLISLRASLAAMILTTPFWVVKTRLALYKETHANPNKMPGSVIVNVVKDMAMNEGPKAFFKGIGPSIALSSYGIIQMFCYENVNQLLGYQTGQKMTRDNFMIPFITGGLSKSLASFSLMPLNVVRLRLQMKQYSSVQVEKLGLKVEHNNREAIEYKGMVDCATKMYRNEGMQAFYKGLTPNLIKVFPSSGLFFLSYELTMRHLQESQFGNGLEKVD